MIPAERLHCPPAGEPQTLSDFACAAYGELRRIAAHYFKREPKGHTLQATALVHEVYIRLERNGPKRYANRAQFFAIASRAMRQILVEAARKRAAAKRGGGWQRVPFDELPLDPIEGRDYLAIDAALERLAVLDPRLAQIAELRLFAGLSTHETASVLRIGTTTVRMRWVIARAWLEKLIQHA